MTTFRLPDLGEGLTEAEIVAWHVTPGDHVVVDQPLVSVETDKAVVEIPSPYSGTIERLHGAAGEVVNTGAPLVDIATGGAEDAGAIVGEIKQVATVSHAKPAQIPKQLSEGVAAAPAVRRLAAELGIDLADIAGSGPDGTILSSDVREAAVGASRKGEPLHGPRRSMAKAMTHSGRSVVAATLTEEADIGAWSAADIPTLRLIRALCAGCVAEPALNAHFDGERRVLHHEVDLAIAVDTPEGLFAPVIRHAEKAEPAVLAATLQRLKTEVLNRTITPDELHGGTITLSNFGALAGLHATLVVSPPQVAILGAGRIHDAVLAVAGTPQVRRMLPLSLTFDHRAVTGGEAARFMRAVRNDLEAAV